MSYTYVPAQQVATAPPPPSQGGFNLDLLDFGDAAAPATRSVAPPPQQQQQLYAPPPPPPQQQQQPYAPPPQQQQQQQQPYTPQQQPQAATANFDPFAPQQPYAAPQPAQQPYAAPQPAQQPYAAPQPAQQPYAAPQPAQQRYAAPQPAQQPYAAPQPAQQPYAAPQPAQQPYAAPQPAYGALVAYAAPQQQPYTAPQVPQSQNAMPAAPQQQQQQPPQSYSAYPPQPAYGAQPPFVATQPQPQPQHVAYAAPQPYTAPPAAYQQQQQQQQQQQPQGAPYGVQVAQPPPPPPSAPYTYQARPGMTHPTQLHPAEQQQQQPLVATVVTRPPTSAEQQLLPQGSIGGGYNPQQQPQQPSAAVDPDAADRAHLEQIMKLRRELEKEQERERQKREERDTWPCKDCTFRNALSATACDMCGVARPGFATAQRPAVSQGGAGILPPPQVYAGTVARPANPPQQPQQAAHGQDWSCSICANVNKFASSNCKVCNGFRANGTPVAAAAVAPTPPPPATPVVGPNEWACSVCTLVNSLTASVCSACESGQRPIHLSPSPQQQQQQQLPPAPGPMMMPRPSGNSAYPIQYQQQQQQFQQQQGMGFIPGPQQQMMGMQPQRMPAVTRPSIWPCPSCTLENPLAAPKCQVCETPRPGHLAALVAPPPPPQHVSAAGPVRTISPAPAPGTAPATGRDIAWQQDNVAVSCNKCSVAFTLLNRKHHCRACGFVFCHTCSAYRIPLKPAAVAERVCIDCYRERL